MTAPTPDKSTRGQAPSKPFYESKTVWFNLIASALAISSLVPHPIAAGVTAVGNIVLRIWFTDKPIG